MDGSLPRLDAFDALPPRRTLFESLTSGSFHAILGEPRRTISSLLRLLDTGWSILRPTVSSPGMSRVSANRRLRSRCRSKPSELDDGLLTASEMAQLLQVPLRYRSVRRPAECRLLLLPCANLHRPSPGDLLKPAGMHPAHVASGMAHGRGPASGGTAHSRALTEAEQATSRRDRPSCSTRPRIVPTPAQSDGKPIT
jgi:hypothetical protein